MTCRKVTGEKVTVEGGGGCLRVKLTTTLIENSP